MGFDVIYDPDKKIAALIDPDAGRALGPLISGDGDVAGLLETFVGGIDRDPSTVHPADLETFFHGFVTALTEDESEDTAAGAPAADVAPAAAAGTPPEQAAAPAPVVPAQPAGPGETGALAGAPGGAGEAAPAGGGKVDIAEQGVTADGGLPTGVEQAAAPGGVEQPAPGAPSTPAGIPSAPAQGATAGETAPPQ